MNTAKPAKPAKPAAPAKPAKAAKPANPVKAAKAARAIGAACVMLGLCIASGCATNLTRTPILSESGSGVTVVAYATNVKIGIGTKESTSIGSYKLSAAGGLDITGFDEKTDSASALIEGIRLGGQLAAAKLNQQGAAVGSAADGGGQAAETKAGAAAGKSAATADTAPAPAPAAVSGIPKTVSGGEGSVNIVILGNRATCTHCAKLWESIDAGALSSDLCGATVTDADKTDNPSVYALARPKSAFSYPLVLVYETDGRLAGQFTARGYDQAKLVAKVRSLAPSCAASE